MNKIPDCKACEFLRMYDYGKRVYYCDNEKRIDDMGKLNVDHLPKTSPVWCPKQGKRKNRQILDDTEDIIKMNTNISLTNKDGKIIEVKVPKPKYLEDSIF